MSSMAFFFVDTFGSSTSLLLFSKAKINITKSYAQVVTLTLHALIDSIHRTNTEHCSEQGKNVIVRKYAFRVVFGSYLVGREPQTSVLHLLI